MFQKMKTSYEHTIYASYVGYITQAVVNNFTPLLFLTLTATYGFSLQKITLLTTVNFFVQLLVDLLSVRVVDRVGYRPAIVAAHIFAAIGVAGLALFPHIFSDPYVGILVSVILYAIGGGIIEVLISPIVEACPTERKEAAMSLLHSFYCWGQVFLVLMSTLFFAVFGVGNWRILACLWAAVPLVNTIYFAMVPIYPIVEEHEKLSLKALFRQKIFWLLMVIMVCAGASELAMSQWASAFAESALGISKTVGDLAGPCAFGVFMGIARALYGKLSERIPLKRFMLGCAILCVLCYATASLAPSPAAGLLGCAVCGFSVGIFWPGTFSIAAKRIPGGGTAMYALLALAGDVGCSGGPTVVGMVANAAGGALRTGLLVSIVFPVVIFFGISMVKVRKF